MPPVFLPEEFHGQRGLVGYSPWGQKEPDMTEHSMASIYAEAYTYLYMPKRSRTEGRTTQKSCKKTS